jgi:hypothetical protein
MLSVTGNKKYISLFIRKINQYLLIIKNIVIDRSVVMPIVTFSLQPIE